MIGWAGSWLGLALLAICSRGDTPHAPLACGPGEALAYEVELGAVSVGTWQTRVAAGAVGCLLLRAELAADPLLAAFLPARGRMEVELAAGGTDIRQARMFLARGEAQQETRWAFTSSPAGAAVEVTVHPAAGAAAPSSHHKLQHPGVMFDPLSAFFLIRQRAAARQICILVATGSGPWWLELTWLEETSRKTVIGYRPSHHYALSYRPQGPGQPGRPVRGELWLAAHGEPLIYEVFVREPQPLRARLAAYEVGARVTR